MKLLPPLLLTLSSLFAYDSYVDLQFTADPYDLRGQTHFDVGVPHVFYHDLKGHLGSFVVTPEVTSYVNSNTDLGFSIAKKHMIGSHVVGAHVFYDRSSIAGVTFHHTGTGASWETDYFEITSNYYHPLTKNFYLAGSPKLRTFDSVMKGCKWIDTEFLMKTPYFNIGTGPIYNMDFNEFALHSRIVIPTDKCQISIGTIFGENGFNRAFLSVSFSLMKDIFSSCLSKPISRTKKSSVFFENVSHISEEDLIKYTEQAERIITLPHNTDMFGR